MKKTAFTAVSALMAAVCMTGISASAISVKSANEIKIKYNDEYIDFEVSPIIENDVTLVPLRAVFEKMGAEVIWYSETRTIITERRQSTIHLCIDSPYMYLNAVEYRLETAPKIVQDTTMVPVRAVAQGLGASVSWDADTRTVLITDASDTNDSLIIFD